MSGHLYGNALAGCLFRAELLDRLREAGPRVPKKTALDMTGLTRRNADKHLRRLAEIEMVELRFKEVVVL